MFDEATQLKIAYIRGVAEKQAAAEKRAEAEKQAAMRKQAVQGLVNLLAKRRETMEKQAVFKEAAEILLRYRRVEKFAEIMGREIPYWTKIASIASLLRLARAGKASTSQLAQLGHKLHAGNQRMLGTLTKNPRDSNAVYSDVRNKFQDIGEGGTLDTRIKNLNAFGPNASWDTVMPQINRFQKDFRAIKGNLTANGQTPWASTHAISHIRNWLHNLRRDSTSGLTKTMFPSIHRQLFRDPENPFLVGSATRQYHNETPQITLYPGLARYSNIPEQLQKNRTLFHEAGHMVDPTRIRYNQMLGQQRTFRSHFKKFLPPGTQTSVPKITYDDTIVPRYEAYADGFANNMMQQYLLKQNPQQHAMITDPNHIIQSWFRQAYRDYGGSSKFTNTEIPQHWKFNATGNARTDTAALMDELKLNTGNYTDTPTMRNFKAQWQAYQQRLIEIQARQAEIQAMQSHIQGLNVR